MELLEMHGITKRFPGVLANDNIDFTVKQGEIHALLGENGAGKSTLMNILYGLYTPEEGDIFWRGEKVSFRSPEEAIQSGIGMVHQHFMLVQKMSALQNIVLGLKPKGHPLFKTAQLTQEIRSLSQRYGLQVEPERLVQDLSVGQQQRVEILKALYRGAQLLILDEPTAVLTPQETGDFFHMLRELRNEGQSIILISHRLSEIMEISDRVTILRDGCAIKTLITAQTSPEELSHYMIGRELNTDAIAPVQAAGSQELLSVKKLTLSSSGREKNRLEDISFQLHTGEILGIAGVDGNGQHELAEVLAGIQKLSSGQIIFCGEELSHMSIRRRNRKGIAYIPEDRHKDGLAMPVSVQENLLLRQYDAQPFARHKLLQRKKLTEFSEASIDSFQIKTPGEKAIVRSLSGGNQQKIILARELAREPKLVIACQPTRGLDIGATEYIRQLLLERCRQGGAVLLISTDLEEIRMMSDRIAVMFEGKFMGIVKNSSSLQNETIGLMMGGKRLEEIIP